MKRIIVLVIVVVMLAGAFPALAQGQDQPSLQAIARMDLFLAGIEIVAESLEMDPVQLLLTLAAEETRLAQVIADQGGDAEAVVAQLSEVLGLEPDAAQWFLDAEYPVSAPGMIFGDMGLALPGEDSPMVEPLTHLIWLIAARGDLSLQDIRERMEGGESLREIAISAGLDPDELLTLVTERVAAAEERLNSEGIRAAERPDETGSMVNAVFVSDQDMLKIRFQRMVVVNLVVTGAVAEELGVSRLEVRAGAELGETYAEYVERLGGSLENIEAAAAEDLAAALAAAAAAGLIDEKDADLMSKSVDIAVTDMLNRLLRHSPADPFGLLDAVE